MSQFNYPPTEMGEMLRHGFAKRSKAETLAGDSKLSSNDPVDSYKALTNGNYKGLEGINYGTAGGLPAAMMPDGHVVLISEGELFAGVQEREKRRRMMVERMANEIDRREFGKKYKGHYDSTLESMDIDDATAGLLQARYEADPGSAINFLTKYKIDDATEIKRMQRDLAKEQQEQLYARRVSRATAFGKLMEQSSVGTPSQVASRKSAAAMLPGHALRLAQVGADASSFYLQDDAALTELTSITSLLNEGVVKTARDAFINHGDAPDTFVDNQAFAPLRDALAQLSGQMGVTFDPATVGLAMVMRDSVGPDVRNTPVYQSLFSTSVSQQIDAIGVPPVTEEFQDMARRASDEDITSGELRDVSLRDQMARLGTLARNYLIARGRGGEITNNAVGDISTLFQAVLDNDPVAQAAVSQVLGQDARKVAADYLQGGDLPGTFDPRIRQSRIDKVQERKEKEERGDIIRQTQAMDRGPKF